MRKEYDFSHARPNPYAQRLKRPVTIEYLKRPLSEVLGDLALKLDDTFLIDSVALDDIGVDPQTPITASFREVPAKQALEWLLDDLGLDYTLHNEALIVTTPEEAESLGRLVRLVPGDAADADRTALSALTMENALRADGFAGARVRTVLAPASPEDPPRLAVVFDVERGEAERLGSVRFEGLSRTSEPWARKVAGLDPGPSAGILSHRSGSPPGLLHPTPSPR